MLILGGEECCFPFVITSGGSGLSTKLLILVYSLLVRALERIPARICSSVSSPVGKKYASIESTLLVCVCILYTCILLYTSYN